MTQEDVAPNKGTSNPQQDTVQQRHNECLNGIGEASVGFLTTVGAVGVVAYVGPEAMAAAALEVGIEGGMTNIHVISALGTLVAMPVTAFMDGLHRAGANCGTP